jgi:hypothetical protein
VVLATKLLIKDHGPRVRHLWYVSDTVECDVHHQVVILAGVVPEQEEMLSHFRVFFK